MNSFERTIGTDTAFRVLSTQRRRRVLEHLIEPDGTATVDELVDAIADGARSTESDSTRDRCALALQHVHLPMLAEAGLVEYDQRSETVQYHPDDLVEELLRTCDRAGALPDDPRSSGGE